jgi:hypothetical protein
MTELWTKIKRHSGYEVSDQGRIRSWLRPGGWLIDEAESPRVLRATPDANGRLSIVLRDDRKRDRTLSVGKLVLEAFLRRPLEHEIVCYRDRDPGNCALLNLYYGDRSDAAKDATARGSRAVPVTQLPAGVKRDIAKAVAGGMSKSEAARRYKLHRATVTRIVSEHAAA